MLLLLASLLVLTTSHENCKFTVSLSLHHPSTLNKLYIGTTCEEWNCEIILLKCFPSIHLSIGTLYEPNNNSSVSWNARTDTCTIMGEIDLSPFQPLLMDVLLIIEPPTCLTSSFETSTIRLNVNHFQDFVAKSTTSVLLSSTPSASYTAPLSKPEPSPLFGVPGEDKFLYWTSTGSSYLNTNFSSSPSPCSNLSNTLQPIKLSSDTLLILYNGQLFTLFENQTNYQKISNLCFTSIKLAAGIFNNPAYAITTGLNNQVISISKDVTVTAILEDLEIYLATQSINVYTVMDHIGLSNHARHTLLIRDEETDSQHIIHVQGDMYKLAYTFPTAYDMVNKPTVLDDSGTAHPLNITHLHSIKICSPHIVAMGSVALYSPSFGHSWYNLPVDIATSNYSNYSFVKDDSGRYAIQTPTNLYSGLFGEILNLSDKQHTDLEFTASALITVQDNAIMQTFYNTDESLVKEYHIDHHFKEVEELMREIKRLKELIASAGFKYYILKSEICADHDPSYTRRLSAEWSQDLSHEEGHCYDYVPSLVYLEYGQSFVFSVTFTMSQLPRHLGVFYLEQNSHVAVNLWDSDLLSVEVRKEVHHIVGEVVVYVNLTDKGYTEQQYLPATDYNQLLQSPSALLNAYKEFRVENPSHGESALRLKLFRNTVKLIAEENSKHQGFEMGLNYFADMTEEEKQQYLGLNGTQRRGDQDPEALPASVASVPAEKLWLESVTEVKNQAKCGSCWTFGANGALETAYKLKTGVLRAFSEQELLDCVYSYDGCGGGWPKDCFKYAQKGRLGSMADIPYTMTSGDCKVEGKPNALRAAKVTGYKFLEHTEDAVVAGLATIGALSVCFEVTSKTFQYHKGIYKDTTCRAAWANHAVTAVGYTEKYVLVKNSWGNRWGDNGFIKFTRGYRNCHLWDEASYPILVSTGIADDVPSDAATPYVPNPDEDDENYEPCFDASSSGCDKGLELKGVSVDVIANEQSETFHVALGCPPGLEIAFDFDNTDFLLSGAHNEANVTGHMVDVVWFQYEQLFKPVFKIIDLIGATERQYHKGYSLTIIGGGIDPEALKMYDEEYQEAVNSNSQAASVWHWSDHDHFNSTNNEIRWLCRESSPCHDILPNTLGVPQYCFIVRFSNQDIKDIHSYCIFETEFVTCIHGLPLGILHSVLVLVTVLAFFLGGIAIHYVKIHGISWDEVRCKSNEDEDDDETNAFLHAQAMRQTKMKSRRQSSIVHDLNDFKRVSVTGKI